MTQVIDPTQCTYNKFQPETRRKFTDADLVDLESIKEHGLYYAIKVYPDPDRPAGWYIVKDGWRRICAWLRWRPAGEGIPADVEEPPADDKALFTQTVISNEGRENFNAIQKANLLGQAVELGMTQADAGKLFNPPLGQAAVSHLLSFRKLPPEIQRHVETGAVPERIARNLVTLARHAPDKAIEAAQQIAEAKEEDKDETASDEIEMAYTDALPSLQKWHASYKWPEKLKDVSAEAKPDKGEPTMIWACTDCKFKLSFGYREFCTRPACYKLKARLLDAKEKAERQKVTATAEAKGKATQEAKAKEEQKRQANRVECLRLLDAAVLVIAPQLPPFDDLYGEVMTKFMHHRVPLGSTYELAYVGRRSHYSRIPIADRNKFMAAWLLCDGLNTWDVKPATWQTHFEKWAKVNKMKLPAGWSKPSEPPKGKLPAPTPKALPKRRKSKRD